MVASWDEETAPHRTDFIPFKTHFSVDDWKTVAHKETDKALSELCDTVLDCTAIATAGIDYIVTDVDVLQLSTKKEPAAFGWFFSHEDIEFNFSLSFFGEDDEMYSGEVHWEYIIDGDAYKPLSPRIYLSLLVYSSK
ncbi:MAG: hypothetical protein WBB28_01505 [Crinalium sp.]